MGLKRFSRRQSYSLSITDSSSKLAWPGRGPAVSPVAVVHWQGGVGGACGYHPHCVVTANRVVGALRSLM